MGTHLRMVATGICSASKDRSTPFAHHLEERRIVVGWYDNKFNLVKKKRLNINLVSVNEKILN